MSISIAQHVKYYNHDSLVNSTFLRELSDGSLILLVYDPFDLFGSILIKTTAEGGGVAGRNGMALLLNEVPFNSIYMQIPYFY